MMGTHNADDSEPDAPQVDPSRPHAGYEVEGWFTRRDWCFVAVIIVIIAGLILIL